jgi:hypothetical protein
MMDPLVFNEVESVAKGGEVQKGHVRDGVQGFVKRRVRREERQEVRCHVMDGEDPEKLKERGAGGGRRRGQ